MKLQRTVGSDVATYSTHTMKPTTDRSATIGSRLGLGTIIAGLLLLSATAQALTFNFIATAATPQIVRDDFAAAGARWSNLFTDNITLNINIDFKHLGANILGQTSASLYYDDYSAIRDQLVADSTSLLDATAVAHLQAGPKYSKLINATTQHATPTLISNTAVADQFIIASSANLKALGYTGFGNLSDASISFSSDFAFDFDPNDGITANTIDFVGVATHEIGHAMGFLSDVDYLDGNPNGYSENSSLATASSVLDLFRFSNYNGHVYNDFTVGDPNRERYFSVDGGATDLGAFSTGANLGDGRQASHWKDNQGLGIMDPTFSYGELGHITSRDVSAFDAIGWDKKVPDSSPLSALVLTLLGLAAVERIVARRNSSRSVNS